MMSLSSHSNHKLVGNSGKRRFSEGKNVVLFKTTLSLVHVPEALSRAWLECLTAEDPW